MRYNLIIGIVLLSCLMPSEHASAHFGFADGEDPGHGIFWAYGIVFAALLGFVAYRRWSHSQGTPEQRSLKQQLKELDRALGDCIKQIQIADEYPNECGISKEERQQNAKHAQSIRIKIEKTKEMLSVY